MNISFGLSSIQRDFAARNLTATKSNSNEVNFVTINYNSHEKPTFGAQNHHIRNKQVLNTFASDQGWIHKRPSFIKKANFEGSYNRKKQMF